jgi:hypothetical protein
MIGWRMNWIGQLVVLWQGPGSAVWEDCDDTGLRADSAVTRPSDLSWSRISVRVSALLIAFGTKRRRSEPVGFTVSVRPSVPIPPSGFSLYSISRVLWRHFDDFSFGRTRVEAHGSVVVKALCYKPEGHGFDSRWGEFLNLPNPSVRTRPWGLLSL